jgi:predicted enzyme related to lactoylglutathione lyase
MGDKRALRPGENDMPRVVHFEISADDTQRACDFYTRVFGWGIQKWAGPEDYWLVNTGPTSEPGINGGMFKRHGPVNYVNTIQVESVDDYVARVMQAGGEMALPKRAIPGVGWLAYCKDTEGNVFGLMQPDPGAR